MLRRQIARNAEHAAQHALGIAALRREAREKPWDEPLKSAETVDIEPGATPREPRTEPRRLHRRAP